MYFFVVSSPLHVSHYFSLYYLFVYIMGGDTFEGVEKLTNQEYNIIVPEILDKLKVKYLRAEAYIPLPEKQIHGDIDFLMILEAGVKGKDLIEALQIQTYLINKDNTVNSVYKNKQIDFCFVDSNEDFEIMKFYKSYSGVGAFLGMFLPSKQVKLSDRGLFVIGHKQHIKFQFLISKSIPQILNFYGLSFQKYDKGFENRKQLFDFLLDCRFLDIQKFKQKDQKHATKLTKLFTAYLIEENIQPKHEPCISQNPQLQTLEYFHKQQDFKQAFHKLLCDVQRKQKINKKFNATHIMEKFKIQSKQLTKYKNLFRQQFSNDDQYCQYVEENTIQTILGAFEKMMITEHEKHQQEQEKGQKESSPTIPPEEETAQ